MNASRRNPLDISFKRLPQVDKFDIIELMNHPLLKRHMPLLSNEFSEDEYHKFIAEKEGLWTEHGYGPWAFVVNGQFAGWGGLQPESGETDLALVLHPDFWGLGEAIYRKIVAEGFAQMRFESVIVLLPPTRRRDRVLKRLGFVYEGEVELYKERFLRYRLYAPAD